MALEKAPNKVQGWTKGCLNQARKLVLINYINGITHPPWQLQSLVEDILTFTNEFCIVEFHYIRRNRNVVPHNLALCGRS